MENHTQLHQMTLSRWIKNAIFRAGIDIDVFKAHSACSMPSSKAKQVGIPYREILIYYSAR